MLNVAELEGPELDKWVALAIGYRYFGDVGLSFPNANKPWCLSGATSWWKDLDGRWLCGRCESFPREYTAQWEHGGPIIEREKINLQYFFKRHENDHRHEAWSAWSKDGTTEIEGPTALIAAMRCFVASKFGATFDSGTTIPGTLSEGGTVK
jgi:hypothetical protein